MSGGSSGEVVAAGRWTWTDLRLVPAAVAVWLVVLASPWTSIAGSWTLAGGATALSALVRRWTTPSARVALSVLAAVAVAGGAGAVRAMAAEASPLTSGARSGSSADVVLVVDSLPHGIRGKGTERVMLDATVRWIRLPGSTAQIRDRVVLFAPPVGWSRVDPGTTVRVRARLAPPRLGDSAVATLSARGPPVTLAPPGPVRRTAAELREALAAASARVLGPGPGGLLPGLVLGDTRAMDEVVAEDFRRAGLSHLTAVSGANVAILLSGVLWPLRRRAVDQRVQAVVGGLGLAGFVALAGTEASVLRAAVMGGISLLALAGGRPRAAVPALSAAVALLLLADPSLAADPGFALSVAATAAIVLLARRWSRSLRGRRVPAVLADALSVSAAAGIATAPLVAALSGRVPLVSLPANLLAAPAVPPATVLGLLAPVVGRTVPAAGDALIWLAGWPLRWLVEVGRRAAAVPDGGLQWSSGVGPALGLALGTVAVGVMVWRFPRLRLIGLAVVVGVVAIGWPLRQLLTGWPPPRTLLVACDVGQGDALVVPTTEGAALLIDTGPEVGPVDECLRRLGVSRLDLVLLSHLDADHAGGLAGALAGRSVTAVATGPLSPADTRVARVDELARRVGAARTEVAPGERLVLGAATVDVLAPPVENASAAARPNDLSVLARVTVGGVRILFTGDLGAEAESRILARGVDVRADVLKVPHHGSADVDPRFLAATGARVALISVGAHNDYGHPTAQALAWLAGDGMWIHRTDREGDVAVAGTADAWGVSWRRGGPGRPAEAATDAGSEERGASAVPSSLPVALPGNRRWPVTRCRGGRRTSSSDLPSAGRRGGGGASAFACGRRRAVGGARPPPRRAAARAHRTRAVRGGTGGGARALALQHSPPRRGHRCAGGRHRARGVPRRLHERSRPGSDPGRRSLRG